MEKVSGRERKEGSKYSQKKYERITVFHSELNWNLEVNQKFSKKYSKDKDIKCQFYYYFKYVGGGYNMLSNFKL